VSCRDRAGPPCSRESFEADQPTPTTVDEWVNPHALANKPGGEAWTHDDSDVFGAVGDSVFESNANAGAMPEFISHSDRSAFIAAPNPTVVLNCSPSETSC
jgi:hypothetical protein